MIYKKVFVVLRGFFGWEDCGERIWGFRDLVLVIEYWYCREIKYIFSEKKIICDDKLNWFIVICIRGYLNFCFKVFILFRYGGNSFRLLFRCLDNVRM